jgi:hypothetical protein
MVTAWCQSKEHVSAQTNYVQIMAAKLECEALPIESYRPRLHHSHNRWLVIAIAET